MIIYAIFGEGCDVQTPIFILTYPSDNPTFTPERPKYPLSCPCLFSLSMYLLPIGTPVLDILILRSSLRCAGFGLMLGFRIIPGISLFLLSGVTSLRGRHVGLWVRLWSGLAIPFGCGRNENM